MTTRAIVFDWGDTLMQDFRQFEGPMCDWPHVELLPGVRQALERLSGRFLCVVASNAGDSDARLLARALQRVNILHHFAGVWTARDLGATKPSPAFFAEVALLLGLPPAGCVSVGNDLVKDVRPAQSAGMRGVWLNPNQLGPAPSPDGAQPDAVIRTMRELPAVIDGWNVQRAE
jgi:putative hydrolase of the HAD superfamily